MRTIEDGKSFALVALGLGRTFLDIPRIMRFANDEHCRVEAVIVTGRGACDEMIELVKHVAKGAGVLPVHNGSATSTVAGCCHARLFREHVGMTFKRRLNLHRLRKAKDLLKTTDQTVDCIAKYCGFKNHTRLTEAFYRFEGMPPGQFRRSNSFSQVQNG